MTNFRFSFLFLAIIFGGIAVALYIFGESSWSLWSFIIISGGVGVLSFWKFVANIVSDIKNSKIKQFGRNGTGVYLEHKEATKVNEIPYYDIYFSFKNDYGQIIETKTSGSVYRKYQAEAFSLMKTFQIRYLDNNAIITVDKQTLLEIFYENKVKKYD